MIIGDGKMKATQMIGKLLHGGDRVDVEAQPEGETDDQMQMLKGLAEEIMGALEKKSASDFAHALKAFFEECDSNEEV